MAEFSELMSAIEQFDVEDWLGGRGFRSLRSEEWVGPCPHCGKDDKLAVNVDKKTFHCWVCQEYEDAWDERSGQMRRRPVRGAGGLLRLIEWLDEVDAEEAIQVVLRAAGHDDISELPDASIKEVVDALESGRSVAVALPEGAAPIPTQLPYMARRGITMDDARDFGLFQCVSGRYRDRLVFPVWEDGRLVYWQARAMYEQHEAPGRKFIKALNPPRALGCAVSSEVLMNLDQACQYPRVAIVEGPVDAVRTGRDAVCSFGKQLHPRQVRKLLDRGVQAVDLMWDGPTDREPDGAHPEMVKLAPWLASFFDVRLVFLPHGDPGDWDRVSLGQFRAAGLPARQYDGMVL